jgi:hypothetical protein
MSSRISEELKERVRQRRTLYLSLTILCAMFLLAGLYGYGIHLAMQSWFEDILRQ